MPAERRSVQPILPGIGIETSSVYDALHIEYPTLEHGTLTIPMFPASGGSAPEEEQISENELVADGMLAGDLAISGETVPSAGTVARDLRIARTAVGGRYPAAASQISVGRTGTGWIEHSLPSGDRD